MLIDTLKPEGEWGENCFACSPNDNPSLLLAHKCKISELQSWTEFCFVTRCLHHWCILGHMSLFAQRWRTLRVNSVFQMTHLENILVLCKLWNPVNVFVPLSIHVCACQIHIVSVCQTVVAPLQTHSQVTNKKKEKKNLIATKEYHVNYKHCQHYLQVRRHQARVCLSDKQSVFVFALVGMVV